MNGTHHHRIRLTILLAIIAWGLGSLSVQAKDGDFSAQRNRMVDEEIVAAGVKDPRVIQSMRDTPRHEFVGTASRANAYFDMAMPIGEKQTISPPFVVAYMTEQIDPQPTDNVLEIGTGSGYQAAVLSPLVKDVYTIEIVEAARRAGRPHAQAFEVRQRARQSRRRLSRLARARAVRQDHRHLLAGEKVPPTLVEQLREGGRMIVPVGERYQQTLYLFQKQDGKLKKVALLPTLFVPMTGQAEDDRVVQPQPRTPQETPPARN